MRLHKICRMIGFLILTLILTESQMDQSNAAEITVFFDDFDGGRTVSGGATANLTGITTIESVNGLAGFGTGQNTFAGNFLRNTTGGTPGQVLRLPGAPGQSTVLTLSNLPPHSSVDIQFLFAAIDTWDGETALGGGVIGGGFPDAYPDFFNVTVDGASVFRAGFDTTSPDNITYQPDGYVPPPDVLLVYRRLGFGGGHEALFNLGLDAAFSNIPHSSNTLRVEFFADGSGWEGGLQESWGIENLSVQLNEVTVIPEPSTLHLFIVSTIGLLVMWQIKRSVTKSARKLACAGPFASSGFDQSFVNSSHD